MSKIVRILRVESLDDLCDIHVSYDVQEYVSRWFSAGWVTRVSCLTREMAEQRAANLSRGPRAPVAL